jgi:hypothetical protein
MGMGELEWYHNQVPIGRRIYIHQESFIALARRSEYTANLVFNALGKATVAKILHHHLTQAIEFGSIDAAKARNALTRASNLFGESLTNALAQIGFQPVEHNSHDFEPILREGERINACCFEAGYFTFATGDRAADVMYAEKGSMHEERAAIRARKGPSDLTWINGRRLALLDPTLPLGERAARHYLARPAQRTALSPDAFAERKRLVVSQLLVETDALIKGEETWEDPTELYALEQLTSAYRWSLNKGIFAGAQSDSDMIAPAHYLLECAGVC